MQPETAQQRLPDPWPFSPVHGPGGPSDPAETRPTGYPTLARPPGRPGDAHPAGRPGDARPADHPITQDSAQTDTDELVARLRARRSTAGVAAAYAAAHGHPTDPRAEHGPRRWALTGTTAVVAVVAVLLLGVGVAALSLRGDGVEPLAPVAAGDQPGAEPASPFGEGGPEASESDPSVDEGAGAGEGDSAGRAQAPSAAAGGGLLVHVVGAVAKPGLVTLPNGARVADALEAAGGATGKADLTGVNLARTVADGEQLYVPKPGESVPGTAAGAGTGGPGAPAGEPAAGSPVDLNAADAVALEALPGVGPSIAQAIVEWREANGPFASVDELEDVPGIGPATLEEIRDSARVGP